MDVALVLFRKGTHQRRSFSMVSDAVTIGRREDCDLRVPLGDVSRRHCSIVREDDRLTIQDLGSSNGTFVNGRRIQETQLKAGDQIRVGSLRFIVQIDGQPDDEEIDQLTQLEEGAAVTAGDLDVADDEVAGQGRTDLSDDIDRP